MKSKLIIYSVMILSAVVAVSIFSVLYTSAPSCTDSVVLVSSQPTPTGRTLYTLSDGTNFWSTETLPIGEKFCKISK